MNQVVIAAAVQAAPVFLDRAATVEKVVDLTRQAAANGADLVVFPEAFVPTYPDWADGSGRTASLTPCLAATRPSAWSAGPTIAVDCFGDQRQRGTGRSD